MKKWTIHITILILILVTVGCSNAAWEVKIEAEPEKESGVLVISINEGDVPVTDIDVTGIFEMAKMDHGTIDLLFTEQQEGIYKANLELPMPGEWIATVIATNGEKTVEQVIEFVIPSNEVGEGSKLEVDGAVATINGDAILEEDMEFYQFINHLQVEMYREADKKTYEGEELEKAMKFWDAQLTASNNPNTLLTQIIRLRAMALLATEKGHNATKEEVESEINKVRQEYSASDVATEMIKSYGEEKFWTKQQSQYEMIVLVNEVQQDIIEAKKRENPEAPMQEVNFYAQKDYEELLVNQVESLTIEILTN